jgi:two-component system, chemotaxis family, sensor kinase CheA
MTDKSENFADDMAEYLPTFLDETEEQLDDLVETLLVLERDSTNSDALNESFRLIHSIKGSAGIMGFESITVLTHHLENRFEQFRSRRARLDEPTMNLVLRCIDFLRHCNGRIRSGQQLGSSTELLQELKELEERSAKEGSAKAEQAIAEPALPASTLVKESETNSFDLPESSSSSIESGELEETLVRMVVSFRPRLQLVDLKAQLIVARLSAIGDIRYTRPEISQLADIEQLERFEIHIQTAEQLSHLKAVADVDGVESIEFKGFLSEQTSATRPVSSSQSPHHDSSNEQKDPEVSAVDNRTVLPAGTAAGESASDSSPVVVPSQSAALVSFATVESQPEANPPDANEAATSKVAETMRVEIDRLDHLMNLAGELVVNRARFEQISAEFNPEVRKKNMLNRIRDFSDVLRRTIAALENGSDREGDRSSQVQQLRDGLQLLDEQSEIWNNGRQYFSQMDDAIDQLSRVSHGLRRGVLGTRMVPVAPLFNRFRRVVRDLSKERGKQVNLIIAGEKTELDKRMIDDLGDPLIHLVRNSIDHGLETVEERKLAGKPETGNVWLQATHRGNNIFIVVRDDGRGIDVEKIKKKLVDRQILSASVAQELSRDQAMDYIWHAGFSTASVVTDVSGRGVGMDVVKTRLNQMNGTIQVDSIPGQGTTFTIRLPLTLAIITSLMVRLRHATFALPIDDVREIVSIAPNDITVVLGKQTFEVRGEFIPLLQIDDIFHWHGIDYGNSGTRKKGHYSSPNKKQEVVILHAAGKTIGLQVDELLGSQDLVIKSLSDNFVSIRGLSGASILGDGSVCLMLEVGTVIDMAIRSPRLKPIG